jgi:hypothetical protein
MTVTVGSFMVRASANLHGSPANTVALPQRLQATPVLWRYGRDKSQADAR